jgi:hypothetical protein
MVKGVRSFLGFANFYRHFVEHFSDVVRLLTELTHMDRAFEWSAEAEQAFRKMKRIFLSELALLQFAFNKPTRIETDSSR